MTIAAILDDKDPSLLASGLEPDVGRCACVAPHGDAGGDVHLRKIDDAKAPAFPQAVHGVVGSDGFEAALARHLDATGRYRVLHPIPALPDFRSRLLEQGFGIAVALDLECTGIEATAEVIEIGMVRFAYSLADGVLLGVLGTFSCLQQPQRPIPEDVVKLTGISNEDVAGMAIDDDAVERFVAGARVVIAHNAAFDRPFAERRWACFSRLPWACSCTEIDWRGHGYESARLGHLLTQAGYHHAGHRALGDVVAMLHLLGLDLEASGCSGLSALLAHARKTSFRIWAEGAPYAAKDILKKRGYRWSDAASGMRKAWYRDVFEDAVEAEVAFLRSDVLHDAGASVPLVSRTAMDRFSARPGRPVAYGGSVREIADAV